MALAQPLQAQPELVAELSVRLRHSQDLQNFVPSLAQLSNRGLGMEGIDANNAKKWPATARCPSSLASPAMSESVPRVSLLIDGELVVSASTQWQDV
ncbi:hypothetical protein, partial [Xanthomonas citri]|uniref:hypothetical protein n=2 Tax=Xanthomonas citri TaxID=346 RepID=UPI001F18F0F4